VGLEVRVVRAKTGKAEDVIKRDLKSLNWYLVLGQRHETQRNTKTFP
jgi:hypothetical protein